MQRCHSCKSMSILECGCFLTIWLTLPLSIDEIQAAIFNQFLFYYDINNARKTIQRLEESIDKEDNSIKRAVQLCRRRIDSLDGKGWVPSTFAQFITIIAVLKDFDVAQIIYDNAASAVRCEFPFPQCSLQVWQQDIGNDNGEFDSKKIKYRLWGPSQHTLADFLSRQKFGEAYFINCLNKSFQAFADHGMGTPENPTTILPGETIESRKGNQYYDMKLIAPKASSLPIPSWHIKDKAPKKVKPAPKICKYHASWPLQTTDLHQQEHQIDDFAKSNNNGVASRSTKSSTPNCDLKHTKQQEHRQQQEQRRTITMWVVITT